MTVYFYKTKALDLLFPAKLRHFLETGFDVKWHIESTLSYVSLVLIIAMVDLEVFTCSL